MIYAKLGFGILLLWDHCCLEYLFAYSLGPEPMEKVRLFYEKDDVVFVDGGNKKSIKTVSLLMYGFQLAWMMLN